MDLGDVEGHLNGLTGTNSLNTGCWAAAASPPEDSGEKKAIFWSPSSKQHKFSPEIPSHAHQILAFGSGFVGAGAANLSASSVFSDAKMPFTPSQWMELEHQALIYKFLHLKTPIPSNLLASVGKRMVSPLLSSSTRSVGTYAMGWKPFHLNICMNAEMEMRRCRRTDGKKWRCTRDAVLDHKYCERHMNRNRHRSRKPVEGQTGPAVKAMQAVNPHPLITAANSGNSIAMAQVLGSMCCSPQVQLNGEKGSKDCGRDGFNLSLTESSAAGILGTLKESGQFKTASFALEHEAVTLQSAFNSFGSSFVENKIEEYDSSVDYWSALTTDNWNVLSRRKISPGSSLTMITQNFQKSSTPSSETVTSSSLNADISFSAASNEESQPEKSWISAVWETSPGGPLGEILSNSNSRAANCPQYRHSSTSLK